MSANTGQATQRCGLIHHPYAPDAERRLLVLSGGRDIGLGVHLLDARLRSDEGLARAVESTATRDELLSSCTELVLTMASSFSGPMVTVTNEIDDPDLAATMREMEVATQQQKLVVFLLNLALSFRDDIVEHLNACTTCGAVPDSCPLTVSERFVRDLADAVACQIGTAISQVTVDGLDYRHALDVAYCLAQAIRDQYGVAIEDQLSTLSALPLELVAKHEAE
jgi:hypothetical protein